jgi:hypothetical protein
LVCSWGLSGERGRGGELPRVRRAALKPPAPLG